MGQDKQQLAKLLNFVKAVYDNPENKEFSLGIQSLILHDIKVGKEQWSDKIDEIYEYCLSKNLRDQAEDLYRNFPLQDIIPSLVEDFVKMEESRRKNDFNDFGLRLYQQVENIVNTISMDETYGNVVARMLEQPYLLKYDKDSNTLIRDAQGKNIATFALTDSDKNPVSKKIGTPVKDMFAKDKMRLVLYFICYKGAMQNKYFDDWNKYTHLFDDIYRIRNYVHRGGIEKTDDKRYNAIHSQFGQYYLKFTSALLFLIEGVQRGYPLSDNLIGYPNKG